MPVLTRNMRKDAGLPALPARFPSDVPKIASRAAQPGVRAPRVAPRSTLRIPSPVVFSPPARHEPLSPLTSLTLTHSTSSRHSSHSHRSSTSSGYSSSAYLDDDDGTETETETLYGMHPGVQKLQRMPNPAKWNLYEERDSMRMCPIHVPIPVSSVPSSAPISSWSPMSSRSPTTTPRSPPSISSRHRVSRSGRLAREDSLDSEWSMLSGSEQEQDGGSGSRSRGSSSEATMRATPSGSSGGRRSEERAGRRVSTRR
ncbi:hypothetical protein C8F04DRAFT_70252 [Mycena alexandri]|uniref:Uncharacterized protein n=1 Tax=Mycena alexandri TaxID=1745969 RepID=A0AAD6SIB0_9AGAR|nr:hypothetical protein C8F04DRAFT_70252 [Mycena alexandri]